MKKLFLLIFTALFFIGNPLSSQTLQYDFTSPRSNWSGNSFYDFGNVSVGSTSPESYFSVRAQGFIPTVGPPMVVNAPTDFKISLTSGGPYSDQVSIPIAGGGFGWTFIYVVCEPTQTGFIGGFIEFRRDISGFLSNTTAYPYGNGVTATMEITGLNGYPVPNGSTNPIGQNGTFFGSASSGDSLSRTFTITNSGTQNLDLTDLGGGNYIELSGKQPEKFKVTLQPTTPVLPSGSTTFTIQFGPESVAETYEADIAIYSNDPEANPYTFVIGARVLATLPTLTGPVPANLINENSAKSGGDVENDGGSTVSDRGVCWDPAGGGLPTIANNKSIDGGSGEGEYTASMINLMPETQYDYRAYATNAVGTAYSPASSAPTFWTLSLPPANHPALFTAQAFSGTQINLNFSSPSSITNCDGYLILMEQGSYPDPTLVNDGTAYTLGQDLGGGTSVKEIITNIATTNAQITGLSPSLTYYFALIPYNWNGVNAPTYNYLTANPATAFATTSATSSTWNGTGSWNTTANWSNGVPGASTNAIIAQSSPSVPLLVDVVGAQCNNLTIQQGAYVTIDVGRTLTVNGDLIIESNATGTGSLIAGGTAGNINVSGTIYINQYLLGAKQYHVSPPVDGDTLGTLQAFPRNDNDFFRWQEPNSKWIELNTPLGATGSQYDPPGSDLREGFGYYVLYNLASGTPVTKTYSGTLINTDVTPSPVTYSSATANPSWVGANLVGNPYPSAIDWDLGNWGKTNIYESIYVWDGTIYRSWNGTTQTGNLAGGVVPAMQGFYIWVNSSSPHNFRIPTDARVHSSQSTYKNFKPDRLKLTLYSEDFTDETFIHFCEGATEGFDRTYDAFKLPGNRLPPMPNTEEVPQFYSIVPGELLSINVLPPSKEHVIVQLGFESKYEETFSISASELESFDNTTRIYLQDQKENKLINLRDNATYEFTASASDAVDRFLLHFSPTDITFDSENLYEVDVWSYDRTIFINNEQNIQGEVIVYNMMGQKVYHARLDGNLNTIGMTNQSGYYIVKVISDQNLNTTKVFIK